MDGAPDVTVSLMRNDFERTSFAMWFNDGRAYIVATPHYVGRSTLLGWLRRERLTLNEVERGQKVPLEKNPGLLGEMVGSG